MNQKRYADEVSVMGRAMAERWRTDPIFDMNQWFVDCIIVSPIYDRFSGWSQRYRDTFMRRCIAEMWDNLVYQMRFEDIIGEF